MALRISDSFKIGKIRVGASIPLTGRGKTRVFGGLKVGRTWLGASESVGGRKRRSR